jgi:O-antigen/teichoic acid export membrane protein
VSSSKQSAGRRLSVITVDQIVSGASNVLSSVLAARALGVASFGLFGILFLVYTMLVGVTRGLISDPLLVHPADAEERPGLVIGSACMLGLSLAAGTVLVGIGIHLLNATFGDGMIILGACLPLLILQDLGRYIGFAVQKPVDAVVLDSAWCAFLVAGIVILFATGARTLPGYIAVWAGSGAAAGLVLFAQHRIREVRLGFTWLRNTWHFGWRYLISYLSTQGAALAGSSGVGAIAGARSLGGINGAVLLTRPFTTFVQAAGAANIGEVTRSRSDRARVRRHVTVTAGLTTAVAAINMAVMLALPHRLGTLLLGASWHAAKPLLLPTGVQILCLGVLTGPRAGLLGLRAIRWVMAGDVASTVLVLAATVSGAVVNGAKGALWAIALVQAVAAVSWWIAFRMQQAGAHAAGVTESDAVTVPDGPPSPALAAATEPQRPAAQPPRVAAGDPAPSPGSPWLVPDTRPPVPPPVTGIAPSFAATPVAGATNGEAAAGPPPASLREILDEHGGAFAAGLVAWRQGVAARRALRRRIEHYVVSLPAGEHQPRSAQEPLSAQQPPSAHEPPSAPADTPPASPWLPAPRPRRRAAPPGSIAAAAAPASPWLPADPHAPVAAGSEPAARTRPRDPGSRWMPPDAGPTQ